MGTGRTSDAMLRHEPPMAEEGLRPAERADVVTMPIRRSRRRQRAWNSMESRMGPPSPARPRQRPVKAVVVFEEKLLEAPRLHAGLPLRVELDHLPIPAWLHGCAVRWDRLGVASRLGTKRDWAGRYEQAGRQGLAADTPTECRRDAPPRVPTGSCWRPNRVGGVSPPLAGGGWSRNRARAADRLHDRAIVRGGRRRGSTRSGAHTSAGPVVLSTPFRLAAQPSIQEAQGGVSAGIRSGPSAGASKNVATSTTATSPALTAEWT